MADRSGLVTLKGNPVTLTGSGSVKVGDTAPDFKVRKTLVEDLTFYSFAGKTVIINAIPSLDTPVCSTQTARFNQEAGKHPELVVLTISMDLPMAQARWCQANSVTNIVTASDYKDREFSDKYGLLVKELGVVSRAVIVVGADHIVRFEEIVPEIATEPDYEAALAAAAKA